MFEAFNGRVQSVFFLSIQDDWIVFPESEHLGTGNLRHRPLAVHCLFAREGSRDDVLRKFGAASKDLQTANANWKKNWKPQTRYLAPLRSSNVKVGAGLRTRPLHRGDPPWPAAVVDISNGRCNSWNSRKGLPFNSKEKVIGTRQEQREIYCSWVVAQSSGSMWQGTGQN